MSECDGKISPLCPVAPDRNGDVEAHGSEIPQGFRPSWEVEVHAKKFTDGDGWPIVELYDTLVGNQIAGYRISVSDVTHTVTIERKGLEIVVLIKPKAGHCQVREVPSRPGCC